MAGCRVGVGGGDGVGGRAEEESSVVTWDAEAAVVSRAFTSFFGRFSFGCGVDDCGRGFLGCGGCFVLSFCD